MVSHIQMVLKDLAGVAMGAPLVKLLSPQYRVQIIAEQPAYDALKQRGIGAVPIGDLDDVASEGPAAYIVGCSSPIGYERTVALRAQENHKPLFVLSDLPEAWKRIDGLERAHVFTTDEDDARLARRPCIGATAVGFHEATVPKTPEEAWRKVEELHGQGFKAILFMTSGQPKRFEQELDCVLACASLTKRRHRILVQPNPKILTQTHRFGGTWANWLDARVRGWGEVVSGQYVAAADMTIGPSSGGLTAHCAGRFGVGLRVEAVEEVLKSEAGVIPRLELYERLGMPIIRRPIALDEFFEGWNATTVIRPYDPTKVVEHIRSVVIA